MLNVLRLTQAPKQPKTLWMAACLFGFLLGIVWNIWQTHWAELSLPLLRQEKAQLTAQLQQKQPSQTDLETLQFSLTQAKQRVQALEKRQSMRQDLEEVQALLFAKKPIQNSHPIRLQKLRWQGGHFEWEASTFSPEALQALLLQTSHFERWHTLPKLVQMQSATGLDAVVSTASNALIAPTSPNLSPKIASQSMVFKLEGQIEADVANLSWVPQQP
jgi:hypothetical protein